MIGQRTDRLVFAVLAIAMLGVSTESAALSAAQVYRESAPGVVVIFGFDARGRGSSGTGTIVSENGLILTNNHVIKDAKSKRPYSNLQVFLKPDRVTGDDKRDLQTPQKVRVVARDEALDLALIQLVDPPSGLTPIPIADSEEVEVGESVAAIGHPGGGGLWTLTTGTVSSVRRDGVRDVFQTDTAINPGNSGGPLLDQNGRLIGVNTFVRRVNKQGLPLEGLNYSLRSASALEWLASQGVQLAAIRRVERSTEPSPAPALPQADPPELAPAAPPSPAPSREPPRVVLEDGPSEPEPPDEEEPHAFEDENGEQMFGVPNKSFRLDAAMKDVYKRTLKSASSAFDELDGSFDDEFAEEID